MFYTVGRRTLAPRPTGLPAELLKMTNVSYYNKTWAWKHALSLGFHTTSWIAWMYPPDVQSRQIGWNTNTRIGWPIAIILLFILMYEIPVSRHKELLYSWREFIIFKNIKPVLEIHVPFFLFCVTFSPRFWHWSPEVSAMVENSLSSWYSSNNRVLP
jgi:hypothetical protein